jgi:hypothetical protein
MEECVKQAFEDAYNRILPGLQMLVRDVNLPEETAVKYTPGILIRETAFCDATFRVGGMATTHRFAILTNHFLDTTQHLEDKENWGLCICQRGSRFKVLDIYRYEDKTQITLLHLDEGYGWEFFQFMQSNIEDDLVKMCRERFEKKCTLPPIPEVSAPLWLERCAMPVGINDKNEFIPLREMSSEHE